MGCDDYESCHQIQAPCYWCVDSNTSVLGTISMPPNHTKCTSWISASETENCTLENTGCAMISSSGECVPRHAPTSPQSVALVVFPIILGITVVAMIVYILYRRRKSVVGLRRRTARKYPWQETNQENVEYLELEKEPVSVS
eukprot:TRINITY_DN4626_c0_g1_i1.p1 TRINITY_DN4626_c0_g1~~TRINITY_DN4626_c0_g1_i1.p1  ORF type:complete len:142 (+),score=15.61 TRINITY_DN4626_c0_g1_i1:87-512(+)